MGFPGDAPAAALGVALFDQVGQHIPLRGIHGHFQDVAGFPRFPGAPGFGISPGIPGRARHDLLPDGLARLRHGGLHAVGGEIGVFPQAVHYRVGQVAYIHNLIRHSVTSPSVSF